MPTAVYTHIHMQDTLRLALSKPNTVRHVRTRNIANKLQFKLWPYGGFIMDAAAELGRNPVSKHQIQPEYGDEQADAGRDG